MKAPVARVIVRVPADQVNLLQEAVPDLREAGVVDQVVVEPAGAGEEATVEVILPQEDG
jgi:hypothetical protein